MREISHSQSRLCFFAGDMYLGEKTRNEKLQADLAAEKQAEDALGKFDVFV